MLLEDEAASAEEEGSPFWSNIYAKYAAWGVIRNKSIVYEKRERREEPPTSPHGTPLLMDVTEMEDTDSWVDVPQTDGYVKRGAEASVATEGGKRVNQICYALEEEFPPPPESSFCNRLRCCW